MDIVTFQPNELCYEQGQFDWEFVLRTNATYPANLSGSRIQRIKAKETLSRYHEELARTTWSQVRSCEFCKAPATHKVSTGTWWNMVCDEHLLAFVEKYNSMIAWPAALTGITRPMALAADKVQDYFSKQRKMNRDAKAQRALYAIRRNNKESK